MYYAIDAFAGKKNAQIQSAWGKYDNCHRLFLNKAQKFKSCLINVPIKVLDIKTSTTVTLSITRNFDITVKRLMTKLIYNVGRCLPP